MNGGKELDREKIEEAFRIMGQYLLERNALEEIALYGGSAILFQFDWRHSSQDVDARIISAESHGLVTEAAKQAAKQLDLPRSWINESVAMYARRLEQEGDRIFIGVYPTPARVGLRVVAAKPSYILAMKLNALERSTADDRDFQVQLGVACGASTIEGLRDIYRKFFADEKLSPTAELRLGELARAIQSKAQS